jgi:hypothetical protein
VHCSFDHFHFSMRYLFNLFLSAPRTAFGLSNSRPSLCSRIRRISCKETTLGVWGTAMYITTLPKVAGGSRRQCRP